MRVASGLAGLLLALVVAACHSTPLTIPSAPVGPNEQQLGIGEGSSTGIMLFQFIPINQNDRLLTPIVKRWRRAVEHG